MNMSKCYSMGHVAGEIKKQDFEFINGIVTYEAFCTECGSYFKGSESPSGVTRNILREQRGTLATLRAQIAGYERDLDKLRRDNESLYAALDAARKRLEAKAQGKRRG